jgi:hypothetical protein
MPSYSTSVRANSRTNSQQRLAIAHCSVSFFERGVWESRVGHLEQSDHARCQSSVYIQSSKDLVALFYMKKVFC